jgi:hypothetical protein
LLFNSLFHSLNPLCRALHIFLASFTFNDCISNYYLHCVYQLRSFFTAEKKISQHFFLSFFFLILFFCYCCVRFNSNFFFPHFSNRFINVYFVFLRMLSKCVNKSLMARLLSTVQKKKNIRLQYFYTISIF